MICSEKCIVSRRNTVIYFPNFFKMALFILDGGKFRKLDKDSFPPTKDLVHFLKAEFRRENATLTNLHYYLFTDISKEWPVQGNEKTISNYLEMGKEVCICVYHSTYWNLFMDKITSRNSKSKYL
ncbi:uncharacterized protein LOC143447373 isoform X2 [Clavelina lepadiformis]|uniref:uncharacterized protein LOC143447373 isoform X2 n=1 Tax=Clavelina lepadiformis TaxID=159417 RepID=UPI004041C580